MEETTLQNSSDLPIVSLAIRPIKSTHLFHPRSIEVTPHGFKHDGRFAVVNEGQVITLRENGSLAYIRTVAINDQHTVVAYGPDMEDELVLSNAGNPGDELEVKIWKDCTLAYEVPAGTEWLARHYGRVYKLVRFSQNRPRVDGKGRPDDNVQIMFQDTSQCLIINQASVDHLNTLMAYPVVAEAYRGNIVVAGEQPFAEDEWATLQVVGKDIRLKRIGPCRRCEITTQDVHTGVTRGKDPLATLGRIRKMDCVYRNGQVKNGAAFGVYFEVVAAPGALITADDKFAVIETL